ncbi:MAG: CBS domain-containing protein [Geminicoccaceae bacterium]|nr:CBS domain-containing protein [Geminicoccaceae bacterium]
MATRLAAEVIERDHIVAVAPDASVQDAVRSMAKHRCGSVVVVDGHRLVGIFTERDLATRVVAEALDPRTTEVRAVMTRDPETIDAEAPVADAVRRMDECSYRYMPVMREDRCIGVISGKHLPYGVIASMADELVRRHDLTERLR